MQSGENIVNRRHMYKIATTSRKFVCKYDATFKKINLKYRSQVIIKRQGNIAGWCSEEI